MSAIQAAILKACDLAKPGRNRQDFLATAAKAVSELSDKAWADLPDGAQKWFNQAADIIDANQAKGKTDALPEFPDYEAPKTDNETSSSRRRPASGNDVETAIKIGMMVTVIKKGGKEISGKLVERDKEVVVLEVDGREKEIDFDDIGSIEAFNDGKGKDDDGPVIGVGVTVKLITKRGKEVTGEIIELDDETVVLKTADGDEDFSRSRVESMTPSGGSKKEDTGSSRRRAGSDEAKKPEAEAKEQKRSSNDGVSIGSRVRELIVDNMDANEEQITKLLKKEGLEFRENTVKLNFAEAHKMLKLLRERKLLKA